MLVVLPETLTSRPGYDIQPNPTLVAMIQNQLRDPTQVRRSLKLLDS